MKKILIVDDEASIRTMLEDHLDQKYEVTAKPDAAAALKTEGLETYDLVISDINMPGMKGYEFLSKVRIMHPHLKTVLITAYNVDDYVRMARKYGISNIIVKTIPFNFDELSYIVDGLLSGEIFGLERYMNSDYSVEGSFTVRNSNDAKEIREKIVETFSEKVGDTGELKLILDEIITNAIYHAPRTQDGQKKYREFSDVQLAEDEYVTIECGIDNEKYGISVIDNSGGLDKETVLYKIDRHVNAEGVLDDSGRGIFMTRIFADRMIINIDPSNKTEIILLNYFDKKYKGYKPIYINEL
ncbi:MAG: response regulator [Fibrobacterota bacterium]